jgi:DNA-binding transcriptional LysR family regulator
MSLDNAAVNLRSAQFDIAIVVTDKLDQGVVARKIAQTSLCTYASPAYLQKHGSPKQVDELAEHKCLHYLNTPHADIGVLLLIRINNRQHIDATEIYRSINFQYAFNQLSFLADRTF